MQMKKYRKTEA